MELREKPIMSGPAPPPYHNNQPPISRHPSSAAAFLIPSSNGRAHGVDGNATFASSFALPPTLVHQDQFPLPPQPQRTNLDPDPPNHPSLAAAETSAAKYRECQKNHAAGVGGHVIDGCGEFMPGGEEGTPEAFKCAACDCHRSFHRKEAAREPPYQINYHHPQNHGNPNRTSMIRRHDPTPPPSSPPPRPHQTHQIQPYQHPPHARPFSQSTMMTFGGEGGPAESSSEDLNVYQEVQQHSLHQQAHPTSKKRFRTKFTAEQKDKMMEFADTLGWKIQKQTEEQVKQFCVELGIKRQAFKVWMHNNKQAMRKKQS